MPNLPHQMLVEMFRESLGLSAQLLRNVGFAVPRGVRLRVGNEDLSSSKALERRADLVVVATRAGRPVLVIIDEVQLRQDDRKLTSWPEYAILARARYRCPAVVLVITTSRRVAAWAKLVREVVPGMHYAPLVIGPDEVLAVGTGGHVRQRAELAVLGALVSLDLPVKTAAPIVERALAACRRLPADERVVYSDMILGALGPALKEALMPTIEGYKFRSDFAKEHQALGEARGEARGTVTGLRSAIFDVLDARGFKVNAIAKRRIERETDVDVLRRWHKCAVSAEKASAIFDM